MIKPLIFFLIVRFLGALGVATGVNLIIDMLDNDEIRFGEPILIQHLLHLIVERSLVSELSDDSLLLARLFVGNGGSKILIQGGVIIPLGFHNHNPIHSIPPNISHPQNILWFWYSLTENRCYPHTRNTRQESSPSQRQSCCS